MENKQADAVKDFYDTEDWRNLFDSFKETIEERVIRHYRNCGSHSNIPPCCVEFFIKYWRGGIPDSFIGRGYRLLKKWWYPADRRPAYVVCPKCFLKRYAQPLHECDWESESVRVGKCKPTGRILGFYNDTAMRDNIASDSARIK